MNIQPANRARERFRELCDHPAHAVWWNWFTLLRLAQSAHPELPRIGHSVKLSEDALRFGQPPFFHPPAPTVAALKTTGPGEAADRPSVPEEGRGLVIGDVPAAGSAGSPVWIYSYHFGLWGPFGPLPLHLTEFAFRQSQKHDDALIAFCDVLHHRFLSFFFRAWADARKEVDLDRPGGGGKRAHDEHPWELYAGSLIGLGLASLRDRDRVPDHAKLFYAGRLIPPQHNAEGLQAILADFFRVPAQVIPFVRRTVRLDPALRCRLGGAARFGRLGFSAVLGESYDEYQQGFRIRLGPLNFGEFEEFLPGTDGSGELHDWVRLYVGKETDPNPEAGLEALWDLQLVLRANEVPGLRLGAGVRLGWTTWLISATPPADADDLLLFPAPPGRRTAPASRGQNNSAAGRS